MEQGLSRAAFEVSAGRCGDVCVRVAGEVDAAVAPVFRQRIVEAMETTDHDVIVDLAEVTFMDSSGLAVLAQARHECHGSTRDLLLARPSHPVTRLLEVTGLAGLFGLR